MPKCRNMPSVDGRPVRIELIADLLPRHIVNIAVSQDHLLVLILNSVDNLPYLFL